MTSDDKHQLPVSIRGHISEPSQVSPIGFFRNILPLIMHYKIARSGEEAHRRALEARAGALRAQADVVHAYIDLQRSAGELRELPQILEQDRFVRKQARIEEFHKALISYMDRDIERMEKRMQHQRKRAEYAAAMGAKASSDDTSTDAVPNTGSDEIHTRGEEIIELYINSCGGPSNLSAEDTAEVQAMREIFAGWIKSCSK